MKNRTMRLAVLLLALSLITACFVGGTFAKYTSTATGTGTATVAKWAISVGPEDITVGNPAITFNLAETIKDSDGTSAETDVAASMIAPGTTGSFNIEIENTSDVNAEYTVTLETEGTELPITLGSGENLTGKINMGETKTATVDWAWAFDGDHTAIGITGGTVNVTATITVTQVD